MRAVLSAALALLLLGGTATAADRLPAGQLVVAHHPQTHRPFLLRLPRGYDEKRAWPLVIWLHGRSLRGDDAMRLTEYGLPEIVDDLADAPFVMIAPVLSRREPFWPPKLVHRYVQLAQRDLHIDPRRIYIVGASLGAGGAWAYAAQYPQVPAAVLVMGAAGTQREARIVGAMPSRFYHGDPDPVVPLDTVLPAIAVLAGAGADVALKRYPAYGHDMYRIGRHALIDDGGLAWLLRQSRR